MKRVPLMRLPAASLARLTLLPHSSSIGLLTKGTLLPLLFQP